MDKVAKRRTWIGIIVLLFANSAAGGAEWCSSALADIAGTFPEVPYSVITLVNNIPNLCAVVFTLVAGLLVNRRISLRAMIIIGIGLHAVGGVMPALLGEHSITIMFLGRFAFGIGYGLMQGIGISMSFKLVENEKLRVHAMGWAVAAQYSMNMVAQVVVGRLVEIQWNYAFFIYAWSFIPFLVAVFLCPRFPIDKSDYSALGGSNSVLAQKGSVWNSIRHLPKNVWIFTVIVALYMLCYYPLFLVISPIIIDRRPRHRRHRRRRDGVLLDCDNNRRRGVRRGGKGTQALDAGRLPDRRCRSLIGLYFAQSFAMVCFWLVISGITSTGIIPGCINVYNNQVDDSDAFLATGITESGVNIGAFLTTPFIAVIESTGRHSRAVPALHPCRARHNGLYHGLVLQARRNKAVSRA